MLDVCRFKRWCRIFFQDYVLNSNHNCGLGNDRCVIITKSFLIFKEKKDIKHKVNGINSCMRKTGQEFNLCELRELILI